MSTEYDMEFDNLHALENFLDIYDRPGEAVVTEAIANSVDADSSRVDIKFGLDPSGKRIISFQDDGPGMNEKQFWAFFLEKVTQKNVRSKFSNKCCS